MAEKKYISLSRLSDFLDNLKDTFSPLTHTHKVSDISDYVVDSELSSTSTNPVQNKVIDEEFNAISDAMGALELAIDTSMSNITSGTTKVANATHADAADTATNATSADNAAHADSATKATQDGAGNVIVDTYATKAGVEEALVTSQADWNQNDAVAADHIKNRPFYESSVVLLNKTSVTTEAPVAGAPGINNITGNGVKPVVGNNYTVKFNGVAYDCIAATYNQFTYLGDENVANNATENTHPFCLEWNADNDRINVYTLTGGTYTFEAFGGEIKQLDEKFIPSTIARVADIPVQVQADWDQTGTTAVDYIKNKPTYITNDEIDAICGASVENITLAGEDAEELLAMLK